MDHPSNHSGNVRLNRVIHMAMVLAIAVAFAGYFVGITGTRDSTNGQIDGATDLLSTAEGDIPTVVDYQDRPGRALSPNANWRNSLESLRSDEVNLFAEISLDPAERRSALDQRIRRRAYEGAPPTIPHAIDQMNASVCLVCHEEGAVIGSLIARPIPHQNLSNCTQCHVESDSNQFSTDVEVLLAKSEFAGWAPMSEVKHRYWEHAPAPIPHTTWMRENCMSCHGPLGTSGLQSSHPWRNSCTQCHAPAADLDQRDFQASLIDQNVFSR